MHRNEPPLPSPSPADPPEERILIQVDEPFEGEVDAPDLAAAVAAVLAAEGRSDGALTVVVTGDETVTDLNLRYLGIDGPTDVLSFPAEEPTPGFVSAPEAAGYLGDVIIAFPFTRRQAEALGRSLRDELRLLAVHGTLHLLGFDHAEPAEEAAMWARQAAILEGLP